jgi:hypothetical protein
LFAGIIRLIIVVLAFFLVLGIQGFAAVYLFGIDRLKAMFYYYLLTPLVLLGSFALSARYIRLAYDLNHFRQAFGYLLSATFFNFLLPRQSFGNKSKESVEDENAPEENESDNLVEKLGGPGFVKCSRGYAVYVENVHGFTRILRDGRRFITRQEYVKELINLDKQLGEIKEAEATTKDGIEMKIRDIRFFYRLLGAPGKKLTSSHELDEPYPVSDEAISKLIYNRLQEKDCVVSWEKSIQKRVRLAITDYVRKHNVDELTAPSKLIKELAGPNTVEIEVNEIDPRKEIYDHLNSGAFQKRLNELGTELTWIDIGHFSIQDDAVARHRVNAWQARWDGLVSAEHARGEARRMVYQEIGRAEAQAEMLMGFVHALEDVQLQGKGEVHVQKLVLARIAQFIDAMRQQTQTPEAGYSDLFRLLNS